jgi:hypothetical protein|tara:strand:- start:1937 stop:2581 length:645 start_codon:yes stop_codon:yes gene_type:complete
LAKNIIFITKKNFFFSKLSLLLEKEGYFLTPLSRTNELPEKSFKTPFLFFFLESKESVRDLKKLNTKLYNLVIFKEQKINIDEDFPNATYMSLPLVYNELMTEVERLNKVTKINYKRYKLGKYFYNAKTSQLFEEKSSSVINLTELESKFLNYMLKKNGGATKTQILSEVWKHNKELDTHTLESLIYRLRKKIENNPNEPSVLINDSKRYFIKI